MKAEAGSAPRTARAAMPARQHARQALARGDWQAAASSLLEAIAADPRDASAWEALGNVRMWLQESTAEIEARQRAFELYRDRGDDAAAARVCLDLVWVFMEVRGEAAVANGWFRRAERLLQPLAPAPEHALLRVFMAYGALEDDPAAAAEEAAAAVTMADATGATDIGALARALHGLALVTQGRVREGMSLLDEALAAAVGREITDPQWFYFACCCMSDACDRVRDFGRSMEWCTQLHAFAERWQVQAFHTTCRIKFTGALLWRGDWAAYEAELLRALQEFGDERPAVAAGAVVRLAELRRRQGRRAEAAALLDRAGAHPLEGTVRIALALDTGDAEGALHMIDAFLRQQPPSARTALVAALEHRVRACLAVSRVGDAERAATDLAGLAETLGTPAVHAAARNAAGLVAAAQARHEYAVRRFEESVRLLEASGSRHEAARARIELAESLLAAGRPADAAAAAAAALEALQHVGAVADADRARALLTRITAASSQRRRRSGALTRRQREVLGLVADGLSDRDIATRLSLSEHTVHRHMANVMVRLGVSSRTSAVAKALRSNLLA
jgi:DNA-binding CsgD family transcriptional regulator